MTLNTQVMGEVGSVRQLAESMRQLGAGVEEVASGWHRVRGTAEGVWEGPASESFQQVAARSGKDGDEFARLHDVVAQALTVFADEIDTVKTRMAQAETVAHEGELTVFPGKMIYEPEAFTMDPPGTLSGRVPAAQSADHAQQQAQFDAAKAANAKKQAAFAEAQATVNQARETEKAAHEKLLAALNANSSALTQISSSGQWSKAGERPTNPAALAIAGAATAMEDHAANATRAQFEAALSNGPASTNACWVSLSEAQRGELMSRFPRMVGSADGLPSPVRHTANMGLIGQQRKQVLAKLQDAKARLDKSLTNPKGGRNDIAKREIEQLNGALRGLDAVTAEAEKPNRYLLSIDAPSNSRGQVIIASGNPDTAQNVSTTVPGTYADLSEAMSYVGSGDAVSERAQQMSGQSVSNITWIDYQAPEGLPNATEGRFAKNASGDLSNFQEGLRASHQEGSPPSNNTVIGHSYGSTTVGYAARDHGINSDNIVFIGSPGVGVEHAQGLGVPPENVWSGTGRLDVIDYLTPSPDPFDNVDIRDDHQWFGRNPSNDHFGARDLPVDTWDGHGSYWQDPKSVDGMARVVSGTADQPSPPQQ